MATRNKKSLAGISSIVFFSILALVGAIFSGPMRSSAATTSTPQNEQINLTVNQDITLTVTPTLSLPALTPGTPVFGTSSATVATNATSGFNLYVQRTNTSSTITSGANQFPDATAWNGSNSATATPGTTLSFRAETASAGTTAGDYNSTWWGATDASGTALYAGFPTGNTIYASTSTYVGSNQTIIMQLRADSSFFQQPGAYTGQIVVTAVAQP